MATKTRTVTLTLEAWAQVLEALTMAADLYHHDARYLEESGDDADAADAMRAFDEVVAADDAIRVELGTEAILEGGSYD